GEPRLRVHLRRRYVHHARGLLRRRRERELRCHELPGRTKRVIVTAGGIQSSCGRTVLVSDAVRARCRSPLPRRSVASTGGLIVRGAASDPGEDREPLLIRQAAVQRRDTGATLWHGQPALRIALAEDPACHLASTEAAGLHAQQLP